MDNNFYEGLKQRRENTGKELAEEYGADERDYAYKWPSEDYDYKDKAQGYSVRSQAMKKAKGGMAKGGNWIQGAIKKPGALKKSLGVPADKPIPAKKLQMASKAPGKMGQRARLAMTLKGMK